MRIDPKKRKDKGWKAALKIAGDKNPIEPPFRRGARVCLILNTHGTWGECVPIAFILCSKQLLLNTQGD